MPLPEPCSPIALAVPSQHSFAGDPRMDFRPKQPRFNRRIVFHQPSGLLRPHTEDGDAAQLALIAKWKRPCNGQITLSGHLFHKG